MEGIGKKRGGSQTSTRAVVKRLGLDVSHFTYARSRKPVSALPLPFHRPARGGPRSGLTIASKWFLDRGYTVSVPLEPASYDLITESDVGLQRVQVKTTADRGSNGRHRVTLARSVYDPTSPRNASGHYRCVPYEHGAVDLFFVVTSSGALYLIPFEAVVGVKMVTLDAKYAAFRVDAGHSLTGQGR